MKKVIDRTGWSFSKKFLHDLKCLPLFLVGSAPRYDREYSAFFECEPTIRQYGGWATFCLLIILVSTLVGVVSYHLTYGAVILLYLSFGISQVIASFFSGLNELCDERSSQDEWST